VPAAIEFSAGKITLHDTLQTLCDLYARQAELRLQRIPSILTPVLVILIALLIGCITFGLLLPLVLAIQELSQGFKI
jgi:type II secretory pathway component PulF